jgi:hypothetical protein
MHLVILRFVFIGCLVGGGAFVAGRDMVSVTELIAASSPVAEFLLFIPGFLFLCVLTSFLSVPIGALPASLAGFLYVKTMELWFTENPTWYTRALIGGGIGAAVSASFGAAFFASHSSLHSVAQSFVLWLLAGFVGGSLSAITVGSGTFSLALRFRENSGGQT